MPRKTQSNDDQEKRQPKPKEQFRLIIGLYDSGYVDLDLVEFFLNEETGKRKKLMYDSPNKFKKAINDSLAQDENKLACYILEAMGINVNKFANAITDSIRDYDQDEYDEAIERLEDIEDAEAGEDLP